MQQRGYGDAMPSGALLALRWLEAESLVGRPDAAFVEALRYGLPPTVGYGLGVDRLVWLLLSDRRSVNRRVAALCVAVFDFDFSRRVASVVAT